MKMVRRFMFAAAVGMAASMNVLAQEAAPAGAESTEIAAVAPAAEEAAPETAKDPDRVLMTLNGQEFKAWMAEAMIEHRAAPDFASAASMWMDIQLKAAEAKQRGVDKEQKNEFILNLYRDFFLSGALFNGVLEKEVARASDGELEKFYNDNLERYKRPMNAQVKHITVRDRQLAEDIIAKAGAADANFDELVTAFSVAKDKDRKGQVRGGMQVLEKQLGQPAAAAIITAKDKSVIGPFIGTQGFEVIYVEKVTPDTIVPFDQVKDGIAEELKANALRDKTEQLVKELKDKAEVVKSDELTALEAQVQPQGAPMP